MGGPSATRAIERAGGLPLPLGAPRPHGALRWIRRLEPSVLVSSPSYLAALTRQAEEEGYRAVLDGITTGAEPLDAERRAYLFDTWGAPVSDSYGTTEIGSPQAIADGLGTVPGATGRVAFVVDRDGPIDRVRLRVEGTPGEAAVRAALLDVHPRLEQVLDRGSMRLSPLLGAHLGDQVKAFRIVDRRS